MNEVRREGILETFGYVPLFTMGFRSDLTSDQQGDVMWRAKEKLSPKTDFLIFDPDFPPGQDRYEDEGRSYHHSMPGLPKKVYVKMDDYGSAQELSKQLGTPTTCRYVTTFMLAEEY